MVSGYLNSRVARRAIEKAAAAGLLDRPFPWQPGSRARKTDQPGA
jgi:hypothetical protein